MNYYKCFCKIGLYKNLKLHAMNTESNNFIFFKFFKKINNNKLF